VNQGVKVLDKIYKYMPLRKELFENFLIRGSQKYALNDPFELRPSSGDVFKKLVDNAYYEFAIVSLSETNNNLLMWSHYADQHKGIVLEFDADRLGFESYKPHPVTTYDSVLETEVLDEIETNKRLSVNPGLIQRVRYNSKRPSYNDFENILEHFLVKSDEWIYEKEHRIVLPLVTADRIIVHESHLSDIEFFVQDPDNLDREELPNNMFMINLREALIVDAEWLIRQDDGELSRDELVLALVDNTINEYLQKLSEDSRTIFLYEVDPSAIKSVYFGCKVDCLDKDYVINLIETESDLQHIQVFHAEVSDERFELNFKN
jgi:hypothetical protein